MGSISGPLIAGNSQLVCKLQSMFWIVGPHRLPENGLNANLVKKEQPRRDLNPHPKMLETLKATAGRDGVNFIDYAASQAACSLFAISGTWGLVLKNPSVCTRKQVLKETQIMLSIQEFL